MAQIPEHPWHSLDDAFRYMGVTAVFSRGAELCLMKSSSNDEWFPGIPWRLAGMAFHEEMACLEGGVMGIISLMSHSSDPILSRLHP